jgi:hypothetical protein
MEHNVLSYEPPQPIRESLRWWWVVRALPIGGSTLLTVAALTAIVLPQQPNEIWYVLAWVTLAGLLLCFMGLTTSIAALAGRRLGSRRAIIGCALAIGLPAAITILFSFLMVTRPLG